MGIVWLPFTVEELELSKVLCRFKTATQPHSALTVSAFGVEEYGVVFHTRHPPLLVSFLVFPFHPNDKLYQS
jgi:hypothetical protein